MKANTLCFALIPAIFAFLLMAAPAMSHGLNVFAWLENDQILVQCDFGQGRPAANAAIAVYDSADHKELIQGRTDSLGRYAFVVPAVIRDGHGLLIVADAGQGHRGEWTMDASELYSAASLTAGFDAAAIQARQNGQDHVHIQMTPTNPPMVQGPVTQEQIKNIVQEVLELKLSPLRKEIAAHAVSSGRTIVEIVGGIGWIIGLVGIGLYFKSRKS